MGAGVGGRSLQKGMLQGLAGQDLQVLGDRQYS